VVEFLVVVYVWVVGGLLELVGLEVVCGGGQHLLVTYEQTTMRSILAEYSRVSLSHRNGTDCSTHLLSYTTSSWYGAPLVQSYLYSVATAISAHFTLGLEIFFQKLRVN